MLHSIGLSLAHTQLPMFFKADGLDGGYFKYVFYCVHSPFKLWRAAVSYTTAEELDEVEDPPAEPAEEAQQEVEGESDTEEEVVEEAIEDVPQEVAPQVVVAQVVPVTQVQAQAPAVPTRKPTPAWYTWDDGTDEFNMHSPWVPDT